MKKLISLLGSLLCGICGCGGSSPPNVGDVTQATAKVQTGGVYATRSEDGKFSISKVLACDDFAVHLRFYNEKFETLPTQIDTAKLTYFIGHAPLAVEGFLRDAPVLIAVESVQEAELEGYRMYLDAMRNQ